MAYRDVLLLPVAILALWNDDRVPLQMPRENNLRGRDVVLLGEAHDQRIFSYVVVA